MTIDEGAREAARQLRDHQQQLDMDGVTVGVSRQAIDEVLAELDRLRALLSQERSDGARALLAVPSPSPDVGEKDNNAPAGAAPIASTAEVSPAGADIVERLKIMLSGTPLPLHWQKSHLSGKTVDLKRQHWLIGSAATLQGLGLIFGDSDRLSRLIVETINALPTLIEEIEEGREFFDLEWEANMRGVEMWREANPGNDLVLPDQGHLVKWLLDTFTPGKDASSPTSGVKNER